MGVIMNIADFLKNNKNARKIFGKREIIIIEKQVNGIKLTQSEKNRLSRDIRKKLEFIKELERFSDEFKIKKGSAIKEKIRKAMEEILNDELKNKIKKIILFGSSINNARTFRSDIDIAVVFDEISLKEATKFRIRVSRNFGKDMDIQVYNTLPEKLKKEIDKKGGMIYDKDK